VSAIDLLSVKSRKLAVWDSALVSSALQGFELKISKPLIIRIRLRKNLENLSRIL
jgi:hypothetical protein